MTTYKNLRPKTVDVGRGPEPARVPYQRRSGLLYELPTGGARVPWDGEEGMFWRRRHREGSVEEYTPAKAARQPKPRKED